MATRKAKVITRQEDIDYISNITEKDITMSFMMETFGDFNGKQRFQPYDEIAIPHGRYGKDGKMNKNKFYTTVGCYVFNKFFIEQDLFEQFHYINKEINGKTLDGINSDLSCMLLEDKITPEQLKTFHKKVQKNMPYVSILSPSYSTKVLTCTSVIEKEKQRLFKLHKEALESGDEVVIERIEKELIDFAVEYLKDDPAMDIYLSGARSNLGNHFKNMYIMKGAIKDPDPNAKKKYNIATSNYMDGIKAEEYVVFANSLAAGPFSRAKKTEVGGYLEKVFLYAYQHIRLDPEGSDCGTKRFIEVKLDKNNIGEWLYSYVIQGDKLVEITSENKDKFIGKKVKMRFSALCESKTGICNHCFGNLPYRRGDLNVGISMTIIPSTMKNKSMKAFHDSVQKTTPVDINKAFGFNK